MASFTFSSGKSALITGGASGIGLAVAQRCVRAGMRVLIADNNAESLESARKELGGDVSTLEMDVGKADGWAGLRGRVEEDWQGRLDLLFLNAGIQPSSDWSDAGSFEKIMAVNFYGVVHGITHLLDVVRRTAGSAIVITGSKQGITNPPGNPAYNASKSAVRTVAEQLAYDLRGSATGVHLLVPGWTFTGLGRAKDVIAAGKPDAAWTPAQVVDYLEERVGRGEFYILCPDNEVTEDEDRKRIQWAAEDVAQRRPPLSRWRPEFKEAFQQWRGSQS